VRGHQGAGAAAETGHNAQPLDARLAAPPHGAMHKSVMPNQYQIDTMLRCAVDKWRAICGYPVDKL